MNTTNTIRAVKECASCHEAKELSKFRKDRFSGFRDYKGADDDSGRSSVCIACQMKESRAKLGYKPVKF